MMNAGAAARVVEDAPGQLRHLSILLLEDQRRDAQLVEAQLEEGGVSFELTRVDTEQAFAEALGRGTVDLILSDYNVPGFDGTAALAAARVAVPDTPFIFVSGALGEERAIELLKRGATDYVLKDKLERLVPSVQRALLEAQERRERRDAEMRLRQSEERSRALVAALVEGVMLFDATGRLRELNASAEKLLGVSVAHALGRTLAELAQSSTHEDGRPLASEQWATSIALSTARAVVGQVVGFRRPDGDLIWLSVNAQPLFDEHGTAPIGVVSSFSDITEHKRRAEFEQQLIGIVSHDLRNPLSAILMGAQLILQQEDSTERVRKGAARIASSAERASRLITDLLDFTQARLSGGLRVERRPVDFHVVTRQVLDEIQMAWPERELRCEQSGDGAGHWDGDRLAQIVTNLVTNALRHGAPASPVRVVTSGEASDVTLQVHNQGRPIPPELLPHLFEAMQRGARGSVARAAGGVGLGLFIVDQIARAHEGTVAVISSHDAGTTFTVRLPRLPGPDRGERAPAA
jgi:phosphoserine phosphatase RsbU/P